ncbi:MAG: FeoB-associated Cys-rich membrane protein [Eubacterium sp.]|nr:FeoB-associated Cys-rich membrane protein [Eubacterium sp.]
MKTVFNSGLFRLILILLVVGVMLLGFGISDFIDTHKTPIKYDELTSMQLEKGAIVEGDLYYNLGVFETIEHTRNGRVESTDYRYVIPIGDESYIGFQAMNSEMVTSMDIQTEETYDYLDGKNDGTTTVIHFKGKIEKLDAEDYGYFKECMVDYLGLTESQFNERCPQYMIRARKFGKGIPFIIIGAILLVVAVFIIIRIVKPSNKATGMVGNGGAVGASDRNFGQTGAYPQNDMNSQNPQGPAVNQPIQFNQNPQGPAVNQPNQFNQNPQGPVVNQENQYSQESYGSGDTNYNQYDQNSYGSGDTNYNQYGQDSYGSTDTNYNQYGQDSYASGDVNNNQYSQDSYGSTDSDYNNGSDYDQF